MADENSETHDSQAQRTARKGYRRRSPYWEHFEQKAECKYCKTMLCADPVRDGTSCMKKHYEETCPVRHPKPGRQHVLPAEPEQSVRYWEQQVSTSNPTPAHLDRQMAASEDQLVRMIALHGYPSSVVEDAQFRRFAETLCPDFQMPSRGHVEERCDALFDQEMSDLKDALGSTPGLVSLSVGEAKTARAQVVYIAAHFIDGEWNLHRRIIQVFKKLNDEEDNYDQISEMKDYGAGSVICGDNYARLKETISCWGLPLKVCSILSDCWDLRLLRNKLHFDNLVHLSATQYKLFFATDINWSFHTVAGQLTWIIGERWLDAFRDLSLSQKKRRDISPRLSLNNPWTYDERWYACYYALEILHDGCSSAAAEGEATFHETELTESCRTTLGTTYRAIEAISACSSPTSNLCLIELLKLKKKLDFEYTKASRRNEDIDYDDRDGPIFTECLKSAKDDLEAYLSRKYLSQSIPLVLDPRFKLTYVERIFKEANLAPDCSSEVRVTMHQLFMEYSNQGNEMDVDPSLQGLDSTCQVINPSGQVQEQAHLSSQERRTELDDYLQDETVPMEQHDFDILKWWKGNCHRYPTIARMARDFLAIPTSRRSTSQQITEITNHLRRYAGC